MPKLVRVRPEPSASDMLEDLAEQMALQKRFWTNIAVPCLTGKSEITDSLLSTGNLIFNVERKRGWNKSKILSKVRSKDFRTI